MRKDVLRIGVDLQEFAQFALDEKDFRESIENFDPSKLSISGTVQLLNSQAGFMTSEQIKELE